MRASDRIQIMWMAFVFLGVFLHAITNHIDNFLVGKSEEAADVSTGSLIIFSAVSGALGVGLSYVLGGADIFFVELADRLILMLVGCMEVVAILLYLYALGDEEVTSVTLWWSFSPVFALVLGRIFLQETITEVQAVGLGIIMVASVLLAFKRSEASWIFKGRTTSLMLGSAFLYGLTYVLFKFSTVSESAFWASSFWGYMGMTGMGCLLFLLFREYREGFVTLIQKSGKLMMGGNVLNEILYMSGAALSMFASLSVSPAFVLAAENVQPLFVLITSYLVSLYVPGYDADDLSRSGIIKKVLLVVVMGIGLYLLE